MRYMMRTYRRQDGHATFFGCQIGLQGLDDPLSDGLVFVFTQDQRKYRRSWAHKHSDIRSTGCISSQIS